MKSSQPRLGVNIDHIATLREARKISYPDPFESLIILQQCCVDQVTCHLREDRRHIHDDDLKRIVQSKILPVNMEMALTDEMISIATKLKPHTCTLVPEKREEVTTEGGLDVRFHFQKLKECLAELKRTGLRTSLFVDPDLDQIKMSADLNVDGVELHTGSYCHAFSSQKEDDEFDRLHQAAQFAKKCGLKVFAGHGLNIENLSKLTQIKEIEEYNIGHSIIAKAVFIGLGQAIKEIQDILVANCRVSGHR